MKKEITVGLIIAMALLLATPMLISPVKATTPTRTKGPRSDYADIYFYGSQAAAWAALKRGDVDFIQWWLTYDQLIEAQNDPDISVVAYAENGMTEIDINNNYTIAEYPGIRSPTNDANFRRAIASAIDKDYIIAAIYNGFGEKMDVPICAPQKGWWNPDVTGDNYPYPFDMDQARAYFNAAGFIDTDGDGVVEYPADWPGLEGLSVDEREMTNYPLIFYVRTEDLRLSVGRYVYDQLTTLLGDGAINKIEATSDVAFPAVMEQRNYHLYTGGWSFGRFPTYVYSLFDSDYWYPNGPNYVTGMNASNLPNYPELDYWLEKFYYAPTLDDAKYALNKAQEILIDQIPNIPIFSATSFVAWRTSVAGVVNMKGYGFENGVTFQNAYRIDEPGAPIRMGTIAAPKMLNILYSQWYYDYAVIDRLSDGFIGVNPYDLSIDQPGIAKDWRISDWVDPTDGKTKTVIRYYMRDDVGIAAPQTGEFVRYFNASDYEWTVYYELAFPDSWQYSGFEDVRYVKIVDEHTVDVYFNDKSMWFVYAPTAYFLNRYELEPLLCKADGSVTFTIDATPKDTNMTIPGLPDDYTGNIIRVLSADEDGTPLQEHVDFEIVATSDTGRRDTIWFLRDFPAGSITINYVYADKAAKGYYLAGLDWTQVMYSIGLYYLAGITTGVGGEATLNANPYYYLDIPPLGEIDWRYFWNSPNTHSTAETHPIGGYYQINILDVSRAAGSYGYRGTGTYDPNFFAGADIDAYDPGHIGITDITTITGKYGLKWGIYDP